jgi:hypothetical protein
MNKLAATVDRGKQLVEEALSGRLDAEVGFAETDFPAAASA